MAIYEVSIPLRFPATITEFYSRDEWQQAVERAAETVILDPFVCHSPTCPNAADDPPDDPCDCPVDWEGVAADDLHYWGLIDVQALRAVAAGIIQLNPHQALRVQRLAQDMLQLLAQGGGES